MAKEQKRGNREAKKPKQIKAAVVPSSVSPFASAVKAQSAGKAGGKGKG